MISVEEALAIVLEWSRPLPFVRVPLAKAWSRVLAEPIVADIDLPPFDKAIVDGYAVRSADCGLVGSNLLTIGEEIPAGKTPSRPLTPGEAAVIMTGAPLPDGADAVVMREKTRIRDDDYVEIPGPVNSGGGLIRRGREMKAGQTLMEPDGSWLNAIQLGVLASVGKAEVLVTPRPTVIIMPTGDELVPIDQVPGPGQIRETNSTVLAGLVRTTQIHGEAIVHPTVPDEPETLRRAVERVLSDRPDILILSGGVSAGNRDLVPAALAANGVETLFHKVRVKPGKPLLFGIAKHAPSESSPDGHLTLVFGLPGNPVSGLLGFMLFVAPALRRMAMGRLLGIPRCDSYFGSFEVTIAAPFRHRGDRPTFHPSIRHFSDEESRHEATPLDWAGSSDLLTVSRANGFIRFAEGDRDYEVGETVDFWPYFFDP